MTQKLPDFIINGYKKKLYDTKRESFNITTVCEEAKCPNRGECFSKKTVTFLLLGDTCTRHCTYCNISSGTPGHYNVEKDTKEILKTIKQFGIRFVVLTSVTRDDLPDGGASAFVYVVEAIKQLDPTIKIEVLTPDFKGNLDTLNSILKSPITVFNHNLETIPRLFEKVRTGGNYGLSLGVLSYAKKSYPQLHVKTGIMVGLGETKEEVLTLLNDVAKSGTKTITIGQYLQPKKTLEKVARYVDPSEYEDYISYGESLGLRVFAGPLVRSSYMAEEVAKRTT
jgi:lipoyl synthase